MITILIIMTILISIYGIGYLIAWLFIDIWNINQITNLSDEIYDYQKFIYLVKVEKKNNGGNMYKFCIFT